MSLTLINSVAILMLVLIVPFGDLWSVQSFPARRVKQSTFEKVIFSATRSKFSDTGDQDCPSGRSCDGICCPLITDSCCKTVESTSICCSGSCCGKHGACCSTGRVCCDSQADDSLCCDSYSSCCGPVCCLYHQTCCGSKCCQAGQTCCGDTACCSSTQRCNGTRCVSTESYYPGKPLL